MKGLRIAVIAALLMSSAGLNSCAALGQQMQAQAADSGTMVNSGVAIVDTQRVLESSRISTALNTAKQDMENLKQQLQNDMVNKSRQLEDARSKNVSQEELSKMESQFRQEIENKQRESQEIYYKKQQELEQLTRTVEQEVRTIIQDVAKEKRVNVVVDKQAVLFGGVDITEDVIKKLNASQPAASNENTPAVNQN